MSAFPVAKDAGLPAAPAEQVAASSPPLRRLHHRSSQQQQRTLLRNMTAPHKQPQQHVQVINQQQEACSPTSGAMEFSRRDAAAYTRQLQQQVTVDAVGASTVGSSGGDHQQQSLTEQTDSILSVVEAATSDKQSCFDAFNPRHELVYRRVVADWVAAFLLMLRHMAESEAYNNMVAASSSSNSDPLIG